MPAGGTGGTAKAGPNGRKAVLMLEVFDLDVRTLAFVSSLGGLLMAVTMTGLYVAGTRERSLLYWAGSGLAFFLGYLLGVILLTVPVVLPVWFWANCANALFGLAHGLLLLGVQVHLGRRPWARTVVLLVLAMLLAMFVVPELRESLRARIIVISGAYVFFDAVAGVLLWRTRARDLTPYRRALASVLLLFAGFLLLRLGYAAASPALTTSFIQDPFQMAAFLANMLFCFAVTIALALLLFRGKEIELYRLARRDSLTGLYNRYALEEQATREARRCERYGTPLSLIMLDIDRFKPVNDRFGHAAGDEALRAVADLLLTSMRETDIAFRVGGEEFLVLLPDTSLEEASRSAERFRVLVQDGHIYAGGHEVSLTASAGVAQLLPVGETWEAAMRRADVALYEAKEGGRNRVSVDRPAAARVDRWTNSKVGVGET